MTRLSVLTEALAPTTNRPPVSRLADAPDVQEYSRRLAELRRAHQDAHARLAELTVDRERASNGAFAGDVDALVSGRPPMDLNAVVAEDARVATEIAAVRARISTLDAAMPQVRELLKQATMLANATVQAEATAAARAILLEMVPLVKQLESLERELATLRTQSGRTSWPVPMLPMGVPLAVWLEQAGKAQGTR